MLGLLAQPDQQSDAFASQLITLAALCFERGFEVAPKPILPLGHGHGGQDALQARLQRPGQGRAGQGPPRAGLHASGVHTHTGRGSRSLVCYSQ